MNSRRNIGSYIPRTDPDGTPNPVLAAVDAGQVYTGAATVAGRPYFTAYAGLHSSAGEVIGMLYVGLPLDALARRRDAARFSRSGRAGRRRRRPGRPRAAAW